MKSTCFVCGCSVEVDDVYVDLFGQLRAEDTICESCLSAEAAQHYCRTAPVLPRPGYLTQE